MTFYLCETKEEKNLIKGILQELERYQTYIHLSPAPEIATNFQFAAANHLLRNGICMSKQNEIKVTKWWLLSSLIC